MKHCMFSRHLEPRAPAQPHLRASKNSNRLRLYLFDPRDLVSPVSPVF
jgi:hypothetical protein